MSPGQALHRSSPHSPAPPKRSARCFSVDAWWAPTVSVAAPSGAASAFYLSIPKLESLVGHVYIKPKTPRLNGKAERSHRIDADEFYRMLEGVVIDETCQFNEKLQGWENNPADPTAGSLDTPTSGSTEDRPDPGASGHRQLHI